MSEPLYQLRVKSAPAKLFMSLRVIVMGSQINFKAEELGIRSRNIEGGFDHRTAVLSITRSWPRSSAMTMSV